MTGHLLYLNPFTTPQILERTQRPESQHNQLIDKHHSIRIGNKLLAISPESISVEKSSAQSTPTPFESESVRYYSSWSTYLETLVQTKLFEPELINAAKKIVVGFAVLYGEPFKLPVAYPLEDGDFELRWDSPCDTIIIQIDDNAELTLVIRDRISEKNFGFDCLSVDQLLAIDLESVLNRKISCFRK